MGPSSTGLNTKYRACKEYTNKVADGQHEPEAVCGDVHSGEDGGLCTSRDQQQHDRKKDEWMEMQY
jgi:hypothetical protein